MPPIIELKNISKYYELGNIDGGSFWKDLKNLWQNHHSNSVERFCALKDLSLEIHKGDMIGLIGRNGAGKSTLLKILSRITEPTEGEILMRGRIASLLEVGTGFHPDLTGRENVFLNGAILGMTQREVKKKFDEIVSFAGVEKFIDTPVKRYSSGMNVRLGFAIAAHLDPDILIIDEVLAVGDWNFQKKCIKKLQSVAQKEGRTVVFVSHQMSIIENLCNKVVLLSKGEIQYSGNVLGGINEYLRKNQNNTIPLKERKDREGSGGVTVEKICIKDHTECEVNTIKSGDNAYIELEIKIAEGHELVDPLFILNVKSKSGIDVFTQHNQLHDIHFENLKNCKKIRCELIDIPLPASDYLLSYTVFDDGKILDLLHNALPFKVEIGDFLGKGESPQAQFGLCMVRANWSLK